MIFVMYCNFYLTYFCQNIKILHNGKSKIRSRTGVCNICLTRIRCNQIACAAMEGILANKERGYTTEQLIGISYECADELLKQENQ